MKKELPVLALFAAFSVIWSFSPARSDSRLPSGKRAVRLSADGSADTYALIEKTIFSPPETPDCGHGQFGPHITQVRDEQLGHVVFAFHAHVRSDNDRCINTDRQRVEIKVMKTPITPDELKGFKGDTMSYRWRFRLPAGFQPSQSFTHLHQLKASDGDDNLPLITLSVLKGTPDAFRVIHIDSSGETHILKSDTPLAPNLGQWLEAQEVVSYGEKGRYELKIRRMKDGKVILHYSSPSLDLWRKGTTVVRPKWGIYRSLQHAEQLRDEEIRFDAFCLAKGSGGCGTL